MSRDNLTRTGLVARGLSRLDAAAYIGVSPVTFDKLVATGVLPPPIRLGGRKVYDRKKLDARVFGDRLLSETEGLDHEDESDGLAELRAALGVSRAS